MSTIYQLHIAIMRSCIVTTIIICGSLLLFACGGGSGGKDNLNPVPPPIPQTYQQPDSSICDANIFIGNGLLCAIQPSRLDPSSRDVFGSANAQDFVLGFGYHVIAFPETGTEIKGINIHITGSYGRPYNQFSDDFTSSLYLNESLEAGFITIQLAYNNRYSINFDECGGDPSLLAIDNCAGDVRLEKITGEDVSIATDTPVADSIEYRLLKVAELLKDEAIILPFAITTNDLINWDSLYVSGHSQGAIHALYLGKYFSAFHVCMIAGGYDIPDLVPAAPPEFIADWFLDDSESINLARTRAVFSVDDDSYNSFIQGYDVLGLVEGIHYEVFSGAPYFNQSGEEITGHSAALQDPRFSQLRIEACFPE